MSCIVDKRIDDNHAREECGSVRNLLSIFLKGLLKKNLPLKFPIGDLNAFKQLKWK